MGGKSANQYNSGQQAKSKDSKGNMPDKDDTSMPGQSYNRDKKKTFAHLHPEVGRSHGFYTNILDQSLF